MTQIFTDEGGWVPVTVVKAGPCTVVSKKITQPTAVQVGYKAVEENKLNKPAAGHFKKKNLKPHRYLKEMRTTQVDAYAPGDVVGVNFFEAGDMVDVIGTSKGKGFQGVMKRHHFAGGLASHGCSISHRSAGSIGQRTFPGKVFKGKKMAGRMGGERVTARNLKVVGVEAEQNFLLIRGSIPGANNSLIEIRPCTDAFEKRFTAQKGSTAQEQGAQ